MIITVSPNTALDRVRIISGFRAGKQSRAFSEFIQPGGSGVHAGSVIQSLGGEAISLVVTGGHIGELWKAEAKKRALRFDMVSISDEMRESFCLIDLDLGSVVESVVAGPTIPTETKDAILARIKYYLPNAELIIVSGSVPPGIASDIYSEIIDLARTYKVQTLADIHSEPLKKAIGHKPWLIKPNLFEFHELIGHTTQNLAERIQESRKFCQQSGTVLALSMSEEGMLLSSSEGQYLLTAPAIKMHLPGGSGQNFIGCGDAMVGALAYEYCRSKDLIAAAKLGLAAAHFNLGTFGVPEIEAEQVINLSRFVEVQKLSN